MRLEHHLVGGYVRYISPHIIKVKDLYTYYLGMFMFQLTHNEIPYSLATIFSRNINVHSYSTRQASHYHIPFTHLAQKSIKYDGPKLWNSLNTPLTDHNNLNSFKYNFKRYILNNYKYP